MAQTTIFNIPSTDTVSKGKGYFEFDFLAEAPQNPATRTYIYNPRLLVGLSNKVEAGVNFFTPHNTKNVPYCGSASGTSTTCSYFQPNVKVKYFANDDPGAALPAGILW